SSALSRCAIVVALLAVFAAGAVIAPEASANESENKHLNPLKPGRARPVARANEPRRKAPIGIAKRASGGSSASKSISQQIDKKTSKSRHRESTS
ncbi:unnamed protein product, partial [Amoebophrya sp. A25]